MRVLVRVRPPLELDQFHSTDILDIDFPRNRILYYLFCLFMLTFLYLHYLIYLQITTISMNFPHKLGGDPTQVTSTNALQSSFSFDATLGPDATQEQVLIKSTYFYSY